MLSADNILWLLTTTTQAFVVYLFAVQGLFRRFLFLNLYLSLSVATSLLRYLIYPGSSVISYISYIDFYFITDILLIVTLLLSVYELTVHLAGTAMRRRMASGAATVILTVTLLLSLVASAPHPGPLFATSLSRVLYLLGGLAVAALCVWSLRHSPHDPLAARLVTVFTIYFSLFLLIYGAHQLHQQVLHALFPIIGASLPLGCGFAVLSPYPPSPARQ